MIGRSLASAMRLKCASAISGDCCSVNGAGGNTSSAEAPPSVAMRGDARRFEAAVGPDAVDDRQLAADLVLRDLEHAPLLVEGAGGDLGRMRVDGDRRDARRRRHVAQVLAEALLVDREVVVERQQHRRDDAVRDVGGVTGHGGLLTLLRARSISHLRGCCRPRAARPKRSLEDCRLVSIELDIVGILDIS